MPTRGEVKVWKPRRADAWQLCDEVNDGHCTCRKNGKGPCSAWLYPLRHCYAHWIEDATEYERDRMRRDASV